MQVAQILSYISFSIPQEACISRPYCNCNGVTSIKSKTLQNNWTQQQLIWIHAFKIQKFWAILIKLKKPYLKMRATWQIWGLVRYRPIGGLKPDWVLNIMTNYPSKQASYWWQIAMLIYFSTFFLNLKEIHRNSNLFEHGCLFTKVWNIFMDFLKCLF